VKFPVDLTDSEELFTVLQSSNGIMPKFIIFI